MFRSRDLFAPERSRHGGLERCWDYRNVSPALVSKIVKDTTDFINSIEKNTTTTKKTKIGQDTILVAMDVPSLHKYTTRGGNRNRMQSI